MSSQEPLDIASGRTLEESCDVVVVGGGGAGLAAAIEAARRGVSVILLEKAQELGGTSALAMGSITAAGTHLQRAQGIEDSPRAHFEDLRRFAPDLEHRNNVELLNLVTAEAANSVEWLKELGVSFYGMSPEPPNRVPRMHNVVPGMRYCIKRLEKVARETGCRIITNHEVKKLIQDDRGGVVGVRVLNRKVGQNDTRDYRADRAVVLACGDYSNSSQLKQQFLPPGVAEIDGINDRATGDGHRLGMAVGADVINMDVFRGAELRFVPSARGTFKDYFKEHFPALSVLSKITAKVLDTVPKGFVRRIATEVLVSWQHPDNNLFTKGAILINASGERFVDETQNQTRETTVARQPGKIAFLVFDHPIARQFGSWPNFISTASGIAYAYLEDYRHFRPDIFFQADTWEDLARKISVPGAVLRQTIADYNAAVASNIKDPWGRQTFADPLTASPLYALGPLRAYITTTPGGLRINVKFQVMTPSGGVIPGLFAAGRTGQGGLLHFSHGMGLAWAFTSGRLAGAHAAESTIKD